MSDQEKRDREGLSVPLHLLRDWWTGRQRETAEEVLADAEATLTAFSAAEREAVLAEVRRVLYMHFDRQHAQLDRAIADEIERRLPGAQSEDDAR